MGAFVQDLRLAARALFRRPTLTCVALATLALGMGTSVTMLSFTEVALLRPLPYDDTDNLLMVWRETSYDPRGSMSYPTFQDWQERNRSFSSLEAFTFPGFYNLTGPHGDPVRVETFWVSAGLSTTLGLEPHRGRYFTEEDDRPGADPTVMLSHDLWQSRFGGEEKVIGSQVTLNGRSYTVIGIQAPELAGERLGAFGYGDAWMPMHLFADDNSIFVERDSALVFAIGRLADGIRLAAAREDMARVGRELAEEYPTSDVKGKPRLVPIVEDQVGDIRPTVLLLLVAAASVLLIVCANLINLLLTRTTGQSRELAIRSALGAGRWRLVRQILTECLLLALVGGALGLAVAAYAIRLVPRLWPELPQIGQVALSPAVVTATGVLAVVVTLLIGLVPAYQSVLRPAHEGNEMVRQDAMGRTPPTHTRSRSALVIFEVALALVVLSCAGLISRSVAKLHDVDLGFRSDQVLTVQVAPANDRYSDDAAWLGFFEEALAKLRPLPGVSSVELCQSVPLTPFRAGSSPVIAGDRPIPEALFDRTEFQMVSPGLFRLLGIPVLEGREFTAADDDRQDAARVVAVSESLARRFWADESALGQRIAFELEGDSTSFEPLWREIVAVVGDVRTESAELPPKAAVYVPHTQMTYWSQGTSPALGIYFRTEIEPASVVPAVRAAIASIDPEQPLFGIQTLDQAVADDLSQKGRIAWFLNTIAGVSLVLALVGIYGVISYGVTAQRREIGIRKALGASPQQVVQEIVSRAMKRIAWGLGLGLVAAWLVCYRLLPSLVYDLRASDSVVLAGSALILGLVSLGAILVPAWQALRLDPARIVQQQD